MKTAVEPKRRVILFSAGFRVDDRFYMMRHLINNVFLQNFAERGRRLDLQLETTPESSIEDLLETCASLSDAPAAVVVFRSFDTFRIVRERLPASFPVLFYGSTHWAPLLGGAPSLLYREETLMHEALDRLAARGRTRIACVVFDAPLYATRFLIYQRWCARRGVEPRQAVVGEPSMDEAPRAILRAFRESEAAGEPWDGMVLCDDAVALPLFVGFRMAGVRVPEDLSVVGVNRHPLAFGCDPPITSVDIPIEEDAARMAELTAEAMDGRVHQWESRVKLVEGFSV